MSLKKMALALLLTSSSTAVFAAETVQFDVEANIPSSTFYVIPDGNWNATPVTLGYDPVNNTLDSVSRNLRAKNTNGAITAHLDRAPQLAQIDGVESIPLTVSVAGKPLPVGSANPVEILTAAEAQNEKLISMTVGPVAGAPLAAGQYHGSVAMVFDAVAPVQ